MAQPQKYKYAKCVYCGERIARQYSELGNYWIHTGRRSGSKHLRCNRGFALTSATPGAK